jgi:hypothetical protein
MTVIDFAAYKKKLKPENQYNISQIYQDCLEDILHEWQQYIKNDKLFELFMSKLPGNFKNPKSIHDLNQISIIEQKLGMRIVLFFPGSTSSNNTGWIAGHEDNLGSYATPEMATEAYSRLFNILLFLHIREVQKSLNLRCSD